MAEVSEPQRRGVREELKKLQERDSVVIRFCGDSGDGMQFTGTQFTNTSALLGYDVSTFADFPAEIRAPAGTVAGLSIFQVNFSSTELYTSGDAPQILVAMNPAALRANLPELERGGIVIVNSDAFTRHHLHRAGYHHNPLQDGSLKSFEVHPVPLTTLNRHALEDMDRLDTPQKDRCKNVFALGLTFWIFDRPLDPTLDFIQSRFASQPLLAEANARALRAGFNYGETSEAFQTQVRMPRRLAVDPGVYRRVTGNEALVLGLVTAARKAGKPLFYGSYPITPATSILEELASLKHFDVRTFQAEDEIAAIGAVVGAAFGGAMAATASSGPGISLMSEGINLAVALELPVVIVDVQRAGPSTGLPTKSEQSDLLQALFGRHGESPVPVLAAATVGDCFWLAIEAFRLAVRFTTPVFLLSDGYLASSSEPWKIPNPDEIEPIQSEHWTDPLRFQPYQRDRQTLARPWAIPGTPGLEHCIGGLGKQDVTGTVSYAPEDHERMVRVRAAKVAGIARYLPGLTVHGPSEGELLVLGWGSTFGAIQAAVEHAQETGMPVASAHLRYLNPFPPDLGAVLGRYRQVLVPELNLGQLSVVLQARFPVRVHVLDKVQGQPYKIREIEEAIRGLLA